MTNRFYLPAIQFINNRMLVDSTELAKQLKNVLRVRVGEIIYLFDNSGMEYETKVEQISNKGVEVTLVKEYQGKLEPSVRVVIYQALLKKDKWEWLLQKVTELGVSEIIPMRTEYCISDNISESKQERYEKILIESTEQCGGCRIPKLGELQSYTQALKSILEKKSKAFLLHPEEQALSLIQATQRLKEISLLIGPEGGFSPKEIEEAKEAEVTVVQMGQRILRAETAGIMAVGLVFQNTIS